MQCPKCGNQAQDDAIFCDQCGTRLVTEPASVEAEPAAPVTEAAAPAPVAPPPTVAPQGVICPACGASNTPGEMFCADCGTKLEAPQPDAAAVAQVQAAPAPAVAPDAAVCPGCGAAVTPGDEFCPACGALLKGKPQVAVPAPTADAGECPACGAATKAGDTFCEFCGAALVTGEGIAVSAAAVDAAQQSVIQPAGAPIQAGVGPVLVVVGSGIEIPLPTDRDTIVGREDPYSGIFPDVDLTPNGGVDGGVSRRHLRIVATGGQYTIEDLNSTNFTLLNRKQVRPGVPVALANGDEITAGRVKLIFKVR